jgi:amino acid adenylation domain-containing protein
MIDQSTAADTCVHDLFAEHAATRPDHVAIVADDGGGELTYGELDERANTLADHLITAGVAVDAPVGVFLERSAEFVVTILAVLKAGGNYVPLDPNYPPARLELMLARAAPAVVVTNSTLVERLPAGAATVLLADRLPASAAPQPRPPVHPDNLAYTMFTSGSTGVPKGVAVRHRGVTRLVRDAGYARLDDTEVLLHVSSTSFDAATFEIWGALANGATLVVGPAGSPSVVELGDLLRRRKVTTAFLTTGLFHLMVDERLDDLAGLRQLLTGGDVMSPGRAHRLVTAIPGCRLVNAYGPTEVTSFTTCHPVPPEQPDGFAVPIGTPIRKTWIRLLDNDMEPVPVGAPGRLYAGGDGLARGYLGDPALTAERFVPDPWSPGERLYDTGDLARIEPDGTVEFLGRADQQFKKRGFRVEPAEIDEALRQLPQVRDAAVAAEGGTAEGRTLVAYLVPEPGHDGDPGWLPAVRAGLRERLPAYLVPDRWMVLDALPLNANGKVDRQALAAAAVEHHAAEPVGDSPDGEIESAIAAIWCEIFSVPRVGRLDDFFELGGHSLLASRMAARFRAGMGLDVPLAVIFDHPTVAELAALVEEAGTP